MKRIKLGNSGVSLSEISLGAGRLGDASVEDVCFAVADKYVELGGDTFDTARLYAGGNCDIALGKWIASRKIRDKIVVVTKGSHPTVSMFTSRLSKEEITADLDESLRVMNLDHSDVHILHRDDVKKPVGEIVDTLDSLVKSGKTRAVGVSNWTYTRIISAIEYARREGKTEPTVCQAHYSLALTTVPTTGDLTHLVINDSESPWYKESGFALMAFGSNASGWFVKQSALPDSALVNIDPYKIPQSSHRNGYYGGLPDNYRRLARLRKLSADTGYSLSAITTAYSRDSGVNATPLCAYSSVAQLEDSFGALKFTLTKEQVRFLETGSEDPNI
ncbi:hypothetical protein FACS1894105_08640 [Clostridia bacterium]|nr:hypothetical protein FACS1894105_08640 [Clostridia bacterium]